MLLIIRKMCPQKNSATMPNKVFANFVSDSNCLEADCVAEKDNVSVALHICSQIINQDLNSEIFIMCIQTYFGDLSAPFQQTFVNSIIQTTQCKKWYNSSDEVYSNIDKSDGIQRAFHDTFNPVSCFIQ